MKNIKKILEALEASVDNMPEWKEEKPATEGSFAKVSDTGSHDMENAKANYKKVKETGAAKKIDVKPTFAKVSANSDKGGATGVKGDGKVKEVKLEAQSLKESPEKVGELKKFEQEMHSAANEASSGGEEATVIIQLGNSTVSVNLGPEQWSLFDDLIKGLIEIEEDPNAINEISTNMKKLTGRNPALNEDEESDDIMEAEKGLNESQKRQAKMLRETIENILGKKVSYA